jgi:hypothetical protein
MTVVRKLASMPSMKRLHDATARPHSVQRTRVSGPIRPVTVTLGDPQPPQLNRRPEGTFWCPRISRPAPTFWSVPQHEAERRLLVNDQTEGSDQTLVFACCLWSFIEAAGVRYSPPAALSFSISEPHPGVTLGRTATPIQRTLVLAREDVRAQCGRNDFRGETPCSY